MIVNAKSARFEDNPARQLAYQLWAAAPEKPITAWLDNLHAAVGEKIAERTVQDWRHRDDWERRLAEEVVAASGVSVFEQVRRLRVAALPAIAYLDAVGRGELKGERLRVEVCKFLVAQNEKLYSYVAQSEPAAIAPTASRSNRELQAEEHTPGWS